MHMLRLFRTALFSLKLRLHILQSNYFDAEVAFYEQLFLQSICFFDELLLQNSQFFAAVIFPEQRLLQSETSTVQSPFENRKFFSVVTFWSSYLFGEEIVQTKDFYIIATFSKQVLLHSINYFRRATFREKANYRLFLESYLFTAATFSKDVIFYTFPKELHHFTAALPFHNYTAKMGEFFLVYLILLQVG